MKKILKKFHGIIKNNLRVILSGLILIVLALLYSKYFILILFILIGGISKFYHRFFKSTLGIDLILFFALMTALVYNRFLALFVAWLGLIIADLTGSKFTHLSLITLFSLTVVIILSKIFLFLPFVAALIVLTIIFEIITCISYYFMGSSFDKILVFLVSHLLWNLFLIISFSNTIKEIMI